MLSPTPATEAPVLAAARFELLSSTVLDLTQDELAKFRAIESSNLERDIANKRVEHLYQKVLAGQAVSFHWVTALIESTGQTVRGNGQHSSLMLTKFDGNLPKGLKVLREHYKVPDGDRFAELFQQFDDRKSARQAGDIAGVYQCLQPGLLNVPKRVGKICIDGYLWYRRYVQSAPTPVGDMGYSTFSDQGLHPFIHWMANSIHNDKRGTKELAQKPVTAAIFATYETNESAAKLFWENVAQGGDTDQPDLPETALSQWLLAQQAGKIETVSEKERYQGCIYAWNSSREERRVEQIRFGVKKNVLTPRE
jgi:hypothetical protein